MPRPHPRMPPSPSPASCAFPNLTSPHAQHPLPRSVLLHSCSPSKPTLHTAAPVPRLTRHSPWEIYSGSRCPQESGLGPLDDLHPQPHLLPPPPADLTVDLSPSTPCVLPTIVPSLPYSWMAFLHPATIRSRERAPHPTQDWAVSLGRVLLPERGCGDHLG